MIEVMFYLFSGVAVLSALVILFSRNILYAAFSLVITFLSIAGIYVIAGAEFVAVTQIIVYVGGIVVLLIFGIMLTNKISGKAMVTGAQNKFTGTVVVVALSALMLYAVFKINFSIFETQLPVEKYISDTEYNNVNQLGIGLMSDYILPFEVAAILLLIALVGAATIAGYKEKANGD